MPCRHFVYVNTCAADATQRKLCADYLRNPISSSPDPDPLSSCPPRPRFANVFTCANRNDVFCVLYLCTTTSRVLSAFNFTYLVLVLVAPTSGLFLQNHISEINYCLCIQILSSLKAIDVVQEA